MQADEEALLARDAGSLAGVQREAEAQRQQLEAQLARLRKQLSALQVALSILDPSEHPTRNCSTCCGPCLPGIVVVRCQRWAHARTACRAIELLQKVS